MPRLEVIRTVIVSDTDTEAPVITLIGDATINMNVGDYIKQEATATDNIDDDSALTDNIVIGGDTVDTNTPGIYIITYNVSDAAGNAATEVIRTVIVSDTDTEAPVITLIGDATINMNVGDSYIEQEATATDNIDDDSALTENIVIGGDTVDTNTPGIYIITYNVSDAAGNAATEVIRTVIVSDTDTEAPVITLIGDATINMNVGDSYIEQEATATDNIDDDSALTENIVIGGDTVDTNTPGTYTITYNVSDAAGNAATEVIRTVIVSDTDTEAPVITLIGDATINMNVGDSYIEQEATATDNIDDDSALTENIVIGGDTVDTNTPGIYIITYNVSDAAGNAATEVIRTVIVSDTDTEAPVITLIGDATINMNVGDSYIEQGATATDNIDDDSALTENIVIGGDTVDTNTPGTYNQ